MGRLVFQSSLSSPDPEAPSLPFSSLGVQCLFVPRHPHLLVGSVLPLDCLLTILLLFHHHLLLLVLMVLLFCLPWFSWPGSLLPPCPPLTILPTGPLPLSPNFRGSASMSTPSPDTLRQALLLEFDDLSPVSSGELAEVESLPYPAPPNILSQDLSGLPVIAVT